MSGLPGISNASSSSSADRTQANTMIDAIVSSPQGHKTLAPTTSDPETASVMSYSSTSALLKNKSKKETKAPAVDAKKLQDQALKSQKPSAWMPPAAFRF